MRWLLALVFSAVLFWSSPASAWGASGHMTVCEIAYLNLTPTARAEVDRLLPIFRRYATFAESCTYPDTPPILGNKHWVNYARDLAAVTGPGCGINTDGTCVLLSLTEDITKLGRRPGPGADRVRSESMYLIGHWVGDVHQPLHAAHGDDNGGGRISVARAPCVLRRGGRQIRDSNTLHRVWDRCIIEVHIFGLSMGLPETSGSNRLAHARRLAGALNARITADERREWLRAAQWGWAAESYQLARRPQVGYCFQREGACWFSPTRQVSTGPRPTTVDSAYLARFAPDVERRLQQAGIRLAQVLNSTLDPAYRP